MKLSLRILLLASLFFSCRPPKGDPFYRDHGDWDNSQIPLIKPYEAMNLNGYKTWSINLETASMIQDVWSINAIGDSLVVVHAGENTRQFGDTILVKKAWFIMMPKKHIEKQFNTHRSYLKYLNSIGITKEPRQYTIQQAYEYFYNNDVMDWTKIEK